MAQVMFGLAIRASISMVLAVAGLSDRAFAADRQEHGDLSEMHSVTTATEPDLDALQSKLRATDAIDFTTKVALKLQFNDLVEDFRGFHSGEHQHSLDKLRTQFADLFDETMLLVRKGDFALFRELREARAGLWQTFVNPVKFAAMAGDGVVVRLVKPNFR